MDNRILLAFYGDDFTGSTDAMEALDQYGLRTILFLEPPNEKMLERFQDLQCVGVAGTARAKGKIEMEDEITPVFERFKEINPYFVHYKVCSTFDSSPEVGSIGYVCDLARKYFKKGSYPLLVAAPALGRYTVFGNHFAEFNGTVYRLDEHPVMSKHPVTPMNESDLGIHLQAQTKQNISRISVLDMESYLEGKQTIADHGDITLFDGLKEKHLELFAEHIWNGKNDTSQFLVGSSGIEYALGSKWKKDGVSLNKVKEKNPSKIDRMLVVSGSVSEVTKQQLKAAEESDFHMEKLPYELLTAKEPPEKYLNRIINLIDSERKVILYTAKGADDPIIESTKKHLLKFGIKKEEIGIYIGEQLGKWTKYIMERTQLKRLVVSGGDTSGFVTSQLEIYGLEVLKSIAPGAPLCLAHSEDERFDALEIALKSGQLGGENFFEKTFLANN